jgi:hypothetical protein
MKTLAGIILTAAALGLAGCGTTEKSWVADEPPPIARGDLATTTVDPVKLPAANTRVSAADITDDNVQESVQKLEAGMRADQRALSKAGK